MSVIERVQTLTAMAGDMGCNAKCPDCISQMTTDLSTEVMRILFNYPKIEYDEFDWVLRVAISAGAKTFLITGKGEPTLKPQMVDDYLAFLHYNQEYAQMQVKELQTNGLLFQTEKFQKSGWLGRWRNMGLRTIALSLVDIDNEVNKEFYTPHLDKYPDLEKTINIIKNEGYSVRTSFTSVKGLIDSPKDIDRVMEFCGDMHVDQCSIRPARKPNKKECYNTEVWNWVRDNEISQDQENEMVQHVKDNCDKVLDKLMHGGMVYQFKGQNLCMTDCLTLKPEEPGARQLIFFPNGMVTYDWASKAAKINQVGKGCIEYLKARNLELP